MATDIQVIDSENVNNVLEEIQAAFFDIPFENSRFQTEKFVIAAQVTPTRAYRTIGLSMQSKIQAIMEAKHNRAKEDIDIEELQNKINSPDETIYTKRRAQLDIDFKLANRPFTDKLLNDAITELNILYAHFKNLPKFTRADFEAGEQKYFEIKLDRQIKGVVGAKEAIVNMLNDEENLEIGVNNFLALSKKSS